MILWCTPSGKSSNLLNSIESKTARLIGTATDGTSGISSVQYALDGRAFTTIEIDGEGQFDTGLGELSTGPHQLELQLSDLAGNQTQQPLDFSVTDDFIIAADGTSGWGASSTDTVILGERDSLLSQMTIPLELGEAQGKRTLKFSLDAQFDTGDQKAIEDIFQVFVKDTAGQTLIDGGIEGTAAFSLAGDAAEYIPGTVTFNSSNVEIDLSSISEDAATNFTDPSGLLPLPGWLRRQLGSDPTVYTGLYPWQERDDEYKEAQRQWALQLVKENAGYICEVAHRYYITPDAIAGTIFWEALENPYERGILGRGQGLGQILGTRPGLNPMPFRYISKHFRLVSSGYL